MEIVIYKTTIKTGDKGESTKTEITVSGKSPNPVLLALLRIEKTLNR